MSSVRMKYIKVNVINQKMVMTHPCTQSLGNKEGMLCDSLADGNPTPVAIERRKQC